MRDSKGRYCTPERHYADKAIAENKRLRYERDKYMRAWHSLVATNLRLTRELDSIKQKLKQICNNG